MTRFSFCILWDCIPWLIYVNIQENEMTQSQSPSSIIRLSDWGSLGFGIVYRMARTQRRSRSSMQQGRHLLQIESQLLATPQSLAVTQINGFIWLATRIQLPQLLQVFFTPQFRRRFFLIAPNFQQCHNWGCGHLWPATKQPLKIFRNQGLQVKILHLVELSVLF